MRIDPQSLLLQALLSGPGFGTELIVRVANATEGQIAMGNGKLYPTLHEMELSKLIKGVKEKGKVRGRPKVVYSLTSAGTELARENQRIAAKFFDVGA